MRAIVLVGGEGTRLRPLTYRTPKPLLPVANVPFLERQLGWLARHGVDEVVLSLGYLPDAFLAHFPGDRCGDVKLGYAVEPEPMGTAGGIRFAADDVSEPIVVCNGDVLTDLDLTAMLRFHHERGAEATIHLTHVEDPSSFGVVPTRPDGEVIAFVEKPPRDRAPTRWVNAGTYILEPTVLDLIPPRLNVSIERETFPRMLERPGRVYAMHSDAYWLDIGTPAKYWEAQCDVIAGRIGLPPAPGAEQRAPGIWVQPGAGVASTAVLEAPVLLGERCEVGDRAHVAAAVLGPDTGVGVRARLRRCVLLGGVTVAEGADLTDTVVGTEATLECR